MSRCLRLINTIGRRTTSTLPRGGNIPESVWSIAVGARERTLGPQRPLHLQDGHPICTLRKKIERFLNERAVQFGEPEFDLLTDLHPVVSSAQCFDELLVAADHPSRSRSDTYYTDSDSTELLRAHMTAHDTQLLRLGHRNFLASGDVYRRDAIDRTHYPIFHQMDGVRVFPKSLPTESVQMHLKDTLRALALDLFGESTDIRWVPGDFPFTSPSFELEVFFNGEWLEVLGCGQLKSGVLRHGGLDRGSAGWAFGLGLERLAMVLFDIPDIRYFWSEDERFTSQFQDGKVRPFRPYSRYPPCHKDISFWIPTNFDENGFFEVVRGIAGNLVERVEKIDSFTQKNRTSLCYRITYRSMDRSLTNQEIDDLQLRLRHRCQESLNLTVR